MVIQGKQAYKQPIIEKGMINKIPRSILDNYVKPHESYVIHHSLRAFHCLEMLSNIRHVMSWGTLGLGSTYRGYIQHIFSIPMGDMKLEGVYGT